jgi:hypothetical protein
MFIDRERERERDIHHLFIVNLVYCSISILFELNKLSNYLD